MFKLIQIPQTKVIQHHQQLQHLHQQLQLQNHRQQVVCQDNAVVRQRKMFVVRTQLQIVAVDVTYINLNIKPYGVWDNQTNTMIGTIPNPTKSITIDFPIEKVKNSVKNIHKRMQFCHFREGNDMFNYYKFSRNEVLSMGVFINVNLTSVSNTRTQINIEITRKMGAFDEWVEVTKANRHMEETINSIANNLQYGIPVVKTQPTQQSNSGEVLGTIVGLILGIGGFLWIMSLFN